MVMLADGAARAGVSAHIGRGALRLASAGRGPVVGGVMAAALALSLALRRVAVGLVPSAARLVVVSPLRVSEAGPWLAARRVVVVKALRPVGIAGGRRLLRPGQSVGEVVQSLPAALAEWPLPVGYIGRKLAALALMRGEQPMIDGAAFLVGGRVLVDVSGNAVYVTDESAAKLAWALATEAAALVGGVTLAAGVTRDAWLSMRRVEAASYVRKNAKAARLANGDKGRALLADLRFMELRA